MQPFYDGCIDFTRMYAIISFYNLKATNTLYDKCFNQILKLFRQMFPCCNELSSSISAIK